MPRSQCKITEVEVGKHRMRVDVLPDPDQADEVEVFEQVIWVEDLGQCYQVHTEHYTMVIVADTMVEIETDE